ncbi:MAG: cyclodeaminase/cyclohydrolase family protein [Phycisphaerae bacterium]|jgi:formiminotetrahydrofolate cyclodeaminase|nr:cyclodeaminase/cyclohydrolase family protein [Phycisphaerae bacterium]
MEKYIDLPLKNYLDDLAGPKDAPGGGSACGLAGALAASLGSMVCQFTLGRKKYAEVEPRIREILTELESLRGALVDLMQRDVDVFHTYMGQAFAMPKDTDEQKAARKQAIGEACQRAAEPPYEIVKKCVKLMSFFVELGEKGNTQLVSDVGVAGAMARAAFEGARLNVEINLNYICDTGFVENVRNELKDLAGEFDLLLSKVHDVVRKKMSK